MNLLKKVQKNKSTVERRFCGLNLYDDNLISLSFRAPQTTRNETKIDLVFSEYLTGKRKSLSFIRTANARFIMDFDVLSCNSFAQTHGVKSFSDLTKMKGFVIGQRPHWRTIYMPPMSKDQPVLKKLSAIRKYTLFRVTFHGGTLEVLAKNFRYKGPSNS
jgi:hypothetical protein